MRMGGEGVPLRLEVAHRRDIKGVHKRDSCRLLIRTEQGTKQISSGRRQEAFSDQNSFVLKQPAMKNHQGSIGSIRPRSIDAFTCTVRKRSRGHVRNLDADLTQPREYALLHHLLMMIMGMSGRT